MEHQDTSGMLAKTKGIVLHQLKYSDTSLIVHIYTELFGRKSFLTRIRRGKGSSGQIGLYQPLFMLEMEIYLKASREIQHIKEVKPLVVFQTIPYDVKKSTVALFLGEILYRTLREEEANPALFEFLQNSIHFFDLNRDGIPWFHLMFLAQLIRYLGFYPDNNYSPENSYFDLMNGHFIPDIPPHPYYLTPAESRKMNELLLASFNGVSRLTWDASSRRNILDSLLQYYRLHIESMGEIKSYSILRELFH